jgi:GntR family transcriptional regulator/MocR family aminotransferase
VGQCTLIIVDLHVSLAGRGDHTTRIYRQVRDAILDGRLRHGDRLPPTRELASSLGVARNTVAVAYERLTAEGFLVARVGAGTYVSVGRGGLAGRTIRRSVTGVRPRPLWDAVSTGTTAEPLPEPLHDFSVGNPDGTIFPLVTWRRLVGAELRTPIGRSAKYSHPAGHIGLRAAIARYAGIARSVNADADDVVVTQGAQQALDLIGRVLIEPGDVVAVEDPGYLPVRLLFHTLGARVVGVPVDAEGLDVAALPAEARLVYVTPSHQFPLGMPMSLSRRAALLDWAATHHAVIVEDDYDSEFRFSDRPLEPLQSLDDTGRVLYVGTFSKTLLPALRLGYVVCPPSLRSALRAARQLTDWHGDQIAQAALARFIESGELSRHVRKASQVYAARHGQVVAAVRGELAEWLDLVPSAAGLHVCARLRPGTGIEIEGVIARARANGIVVGNLADYGGLTATPAGLVLGYGAAPSTLPGAGIEAGLRRLARCFRAEAGLRLTAERSERSPDSLVDSTNSSSRGSAGRGT